jgi:hypothetical protein
MKHKDIQVNDIVKIRGQRYILKSIDAEGNLLLIPEKKNLDKYPTTLYDLGYNSISEIRKTRDQKTTDRLIEYIDTCIGDKIMIAYVDRSKIVSIEEIQLLGSSIGSPDKINVRINGHRSQLQIDDLIDSIDLKEQCQKAQKDYLLEKEKTSSYSDLLDEALSFQRNPNSPFGSIPDDLEDIIKMVINLKK